MTSLIKDSPVIVLSFSKTDINLKALLFNFHFEYMFFKKFVSVKLSVLLGYIFLNQFFNFVWESGQFPFK